MSKQLKKSEFRCQKPQILSQTLRADSPMFALGFIWVCWFKSESIYIKVLFKPKRRSKPSRQVQTTKIRVFIFILQIWNIWKALHKLNFCQVFWNSYHLICLHYIYLLKTHVALFLWKWELMDELQPVGTENIFWNDLSAEVKISSCPCPPMLLALPLDPTHPQQSKNSSQRHSMSCPTSRGGNNLAKNRVRVHSLTSDRMKQSFYVLVGKEQLSLLLLQTPFLENHLQKSTVQRSASASKIHTCSCREYEYFWIIA